MKRRPYEELQRIVEQEGGRMFHERGGHGLGGAWVVELWGLTQVFKSNQAGFPEMDMLYVPKVPAPKHYRDYHTGLLVKGAEERWLALLRTQNR
jgi:hypothetical protein